MHPLSDTQPVLGPLIATYHARRRRWRERLIWPVPGFVVALGLLAWGLDWYNYGYTKYGPAAAQDWSRPWIVAAMLTGLAVILISLWQAFRSSSSVAIHKNGLSLHRPLRSPLVFQWGQITGIASATIQDGFLGHTFRTRQRAMAYLKQGKAIRLNSNLDNLPELITRIKAHIYPHSLPGLRASLQDGQKLTFGAITIQSQSVSVRGREIPWQQVHRLTVQSGCLIVELHNHTGSRQENIRTPIDKIPNLELLLQVIQEGIH